MTTGLYFKFLSNGEKGDVGDPAPFSYQFKGEAGEPGYPGADGFAGLPGDPAPSVPPKSRGFFFTRHSQTSQNPACPPGTSRMWDGYSLLHIMGNAKAHGQDLG
ncbi:hypothetical protein J437_LFUL019569 [Ladona fulva]|uniref:Collagen IV NC1 domain-containing protein n=1 Tax=Ladona fulva TaxID=123851 RepID=A0A8K0KTC7_LADFU|nr:hypothetical protein J437_LFUL019569 [Ladona fulva]